VTGTNKWWDKFITCCHGLGHGAESLFVSLEILCLLPSPSSHTLHFDTYPEEKNGIFEDEENARRGSRASGEHTEDAARVIEIECRVSLVCQTRYSIPITLAVLSVSVSY
jgi:hypothetical protein